MAVTGASAEAGRYSHLPLIPLESVSFMINHTDWYSTLSLADGTELSIAPFGDADLEAICAIENRAHSTPWRRAHFEDSLKASHHHCIGVHQSGRWLGYAIVSCIAGEAELLLLVIDPPWQGRGLARQVLNHLFECLHGLADTLFLEVRVGNRRAIALYESLEFNQVGIRPGYYQTAAGAEDAVIFARMLD
jgi:ribosomal-protein-alanine N-acetyltransferase